MVDIATSKFSGVGSVNFGARAPLKVHFQPFEPIPDNSKKISGNNFHDEKLVLEAFFKVMVLHCFGHSLLKIWK